MDTERKRRGVRLTPEQQGQVLLGVSRKNTTDVEVCRRWGISTYQLKAIREKAKNGSLQAFKKGPGRTKADQQVTQLRQDLHCSNEALKRLRSTLLPGTQLLADQAAHYLRVALALRRLHYLTHQEAERLVVGPPSGAPPRPGWRPGRRR